MLAFRQELSVAVRSLRRSRLTTATIIVTMAVCIGATATTYAVVDAVLLRGLPFEHSERLLWMSSVSKDRPDRPFSLPEFLDYRSQATSVRLAAYTTWNAILQTPSGATRLQGLRLSGDGLQVLGAAPTLGRGLNADDDLPGAVHVAVLSYGYWQRSLAGDPAVVGRQLVLNGDRFTVVGILPRLFPLPVRDIDVIVPLDPLSDPRRTLRGSVNFLRVVARLRETTTQAVASRELNQIAARLREQFPTEYASKIGVRVLPLQDYVSENQRPTLVIISASVALMLAIAFVNVASLLLARAVARQGETAVRLALGASNRRVGLQWLVEGALLVLAAGVIGLAIADIAIGLAATRLTSFGPRMEEAELSSSVVAVVLAICTAAVGLFSLVPMLVTRGTSSHLALRGNGRAGASSPTQARLRSAFVVAEVALAIVVSAATAALTQSLLKLERVDLGYRPDSVFVARVSFPPAAYRTAAELGRFASTMESALLADPVVVAAGATSVAPLSGVLRAVPFAPANSQTAAERQWPAATYRAVTPGYLAALGARRIEGRMIDEGDDGVAAPVVVINRTLAEKYFPKASALGRQILADDTNHGPRPLTVVGVVDDIREVELAGLVEPELFVAVKQTLPENVSLLTATQFWTVRLRANPSAFATTFSRILREVDPSVAAASSTSLREYVDAAIAPRRFSVRLMSLFALVALVLAFLGVYGVTAYSVEQRRREIGVCMAIGATSGRIVGTVMRRSLTLGAIGVALGIVGAGLARGLIEHRLFGVSADNPILLAGVAGTMLVTVAAASVIPSVRASRIDPLVALRGD